LVRAIRRKKQGLGGLELVVSDGHKGIRSAVEKHLVEDMRRFIQELEGEDLKRVASS